MKSNGCLSEVWGGGRGKLEPSALTKCSNQDPVQPARPLTSPPTPPLITQVIFFISVLPLSIPPSALFFVLSPGFCDGQYAMCMYLSLLVAISCPAARTCTRTHTQAGFLFNAQPLGVVAATLHRVVMRSMCVGSGAPPALKLCYSDK